MTARRAVYRSGWRACLRALSYFRPDASSIGILMGVMGAATLLGLMQAWPIAILIDSVLVPVPADDGLHRALLRHLPATKPAQIACLAAAVLLLRLAQEITGSFRTMLNHRIGYGAVMRVRSELYKKLQALHLAYHRQRPLGDALQRLSSDTLGFQMLLNAYISTAMSVVTLVVMTGIMLTQSVMLTLLALSISPFLLATNVAFGRALNRSAMRARETDAELLTRIERSISAIDLVQAFRREAHEYDRFDATLRSTVGAWLRLHRDELRYLLAVGAIFGTGGALIFGFGAYSVHRSQLTGASGGLTVGGLTVFLAYLGLLYDPLCKLSGATGSIQSGLAGVERVFEVLDEDPIIQSGPDALVLRHRARELHFDNVSFAYRPDHPILKGIDAVIPPGQMVAFVGSSGVGKTTLLNLLPRFYDPTGGALRLDGYDLRALRLEDVRRTVALVLQDNVLLPASIAENIAYGRAGASETAIRRAAELAGAAEFIERLPKGYATLVGSSGIGLSGGQRQRIAVARALLTDAPIIVLDEPTSALDAEHERWITRTLDTLRGTRTVVLVSHRLGTVSTSDRIFVMAGGRIVEEGTHAHLLALGGAYARLAQTAHEVAVDAEARSTGTAHSFSARGAHETADDDAAFAPSGAT